MSWVIYFLPYRPALTDSVRPFMLLLKSPFCLQERLWNGHLQPPAGSPDGGPSEALQDPRVVHGPQRAVWAPPFLLSPHRPLRPLRQHLQDSVVVPALTPPLTHITSECYPRGHGSGHTDLRWLLSLWWWTGFGLLMFSFVESSSGFLCVCRGFVC